MATTTAHPPIARKKRSIAPVVITFAIALIGFAVIASSTSGGAGMYNFSLGELNKQGSAISGKEVKVSGRIAKGSVRGEPASPSFRFDLEDDDGNKVAVGYTRLLPDPFEEGRDAIVQGEFKDGVLYATNLTVKCPSRYADSEDMEKMTESQKQQYYKDEYKKHMAAQEAAHKAETAKAAKPATPGAKPSAEPAPPTK